MQWKLKVSEYGKIEKAEIEVAPLTLFVGDNNSGKSYLMSLLWGIQNLGRDTLLGFETVPKSEEDNRLCQRVKTQIDKTLKDGTSVVPICEMAEALQSVLNEHLTKNKNNIIKKIFNSNDIKIEKLEIEFINLENIFLRFERREEQNSIAIHLEDNIKQVRELYLFRSMKDGLKENIYWILTKIMISMILNIELGDNYKNNKGIYLPASRTGFMLTKDVINKVSRNMVFNLEFEEEVTPFTRTINQFLDVMSDLSSENVGDKELESIIKYLENGMTEGRIDMSALPNREISYIPNGVKKRLPLRAVSAVVTELSPLILILKHKQNLNTLYYEEPEMCLHPQLQQKMARVICQLVNSQLNMIVTTHSDIILQHINNMIRLSKRDDKKPICEKFNYISTDLLNPKKVKVYQLISTNGKTNVEELTCGVNGFAIPTFNNALEQMMDEAYIIQE